ncbi:ThuA domain-containing protein [Salipaludibacillus sp. HK11]|uniref:ThuA domain-containing protein n=1 Tax=Salipaludibacillus sp. HK11 TaxID=3394320 RepID=UPI0039FD7C16
MSFKITAINGDFYHDKEVSFKAIERTVELLKEADEEVEINYILPSDLIDDLKSKSSKPDAVILFKENRLNPEDDHVETWMDSEIESAITYYVENGGGWLAWHSGMAKFENAQDYLTMLRGSFIHHPAMQIVEYTAVPGAEFIVEDKTFSFLDEHYFVECDEENTNVLLKSKSIDGESIGGWAHEYGKGRVVCLAPAHLEEGLLHPAFQRTVVNSLKWCRG